MRRRRFQAHQANDVICAMDSLMTAPQLRADIALMSAAFDRALSEIDKDSSFANCDRQKIRTELSQIIATEVKPNTKPSVLAKLAVGLLRQREQVRRSQNYITLRGKPPAT
jgi:hypothetical protein